MIYQDIKFDVSDKPEKSPQGIEPPQLIHVRPLSVSKFLLYRPPKRQSSKPSSPSKKNKSQEEQQEESIGPYLKFKNADYLANKGEQKKKKWKNLKQILDMPSSFTGPEGFENYTCNL